MTTQTSSSSLSTQNISTTIVTNDSTQNSDTVYYHLDFDRYRQHLVTVSMSFIASTDQPVVWLPSWIPGSYLLREFARNITAVIYTRGPQDNSSSEYRGQKISKNEWQLTQVKTGERVQVSYEVYCYDLSVRTAYLDQYRLYGNFTSMALTIDGQSHLPVSVSLHVPESFYEGKEASRVKLVCGLKHTQRLAQGYHVFELSADSYESLIDYPFEVAEQAEGQFDVYNQRQEAISHRLFISGRQQADMSRLQRDVAQICQTYVNWLGDTPFDDYTFMTFASGNDHGGLEHINSTSLIAPRSDLPSSTEPKEPKFAYQRYLSLCSHEYFHAWWVKTVRPDVMMSVDLRREAYTPLLWVFEGFTSYIDEFMLQASKVINTSNYLKLLAEQINRYTQTHGRHLQSVAESSFDAWIKLYRSDENTGNAGISYYNKGALVALCLDLYLMQHSQGQYRLFDIVKAFYEQAKAQGNRRIGMSNDNLGEVIGGFINPALWQDFKARYIDGVEELPIEDLLSANGVTVSQLGNGTSADTGRDNCLPWGIRVEETPMGLKVIKVLRDSVASEAGLSANDIIVAIDGLKADKTKLATIAKHAQQAVTCHAFRRDELITLSVPADTASGLTANPSLDKIQLSLQASGWEQWLAPKFVQ